MMREMLTFKDNGQLNEIQMRWFAPGKPQEELYDLKADPFELTNLASSEKHTAELTRLRKEMDRWLIYANDLGAIPEKELILRMWNGNNKPPVTEPIVIDRSKGSTVTLSSATPGASIGFKVIRPGQPEPASWSVYAKPIKVEQGSTLKCFAHRIGFECSQETAESF